MNPRVTIESMTKTILVVDDKASMRQLLREYLTEQGYRVTEAGNGRSALPITEKESPNLILLDIMMPHMDGYQFISRIRRQSNVPIIMVTAKRQENDVVRGFELGADDYITKPFRMRELLMRIRAVLRRVTPPDTTETQLSVGDIMLDPQKRLITILAKPVNLTPIEFCLLERLLELAEHTLSRAELCIHLMENGYTGSENTLKIHIRNLRQKVEADPTKPRYIETVFGVGYRLREINSGTQEA